MKKFFFLLALNGVAFCLFAQNDTATSATDTSMGDCYEGFFKSAEPVKNPSRIKLVLKNNKTSTIKAFHQTSFMDEGFETGLKDLDGDGNKELMIRNFSGGAHCCDGFYFFKKTGNNQYSLTAQLYAGNTCVDSSDTFYYDLIEMFGYFYTCYACGLDDKDETGKGVYYVYTIPLKYKNNKLQIVPGDATMRKKIMSNLSYIKSLGWDGGLKTDGDFDDGRRKELAMTLATYYFEFGKNMVQVQKLFKTYYPFKDAPKVWKKFVDYLGDVKKSNDF